MGWMALLSGTRVSCSQINCAMAPSLIGQIQPSCLARGQAASLAMEGLLGLSALILMALLGINGHKITSGGQLQPGLSFLLLVVEKVVSHATLKERVRDNGHLLF